MKRLSRIFLASILSVSSYALAQPANCHLPKYKKVCEELAEMKKGFPAYPDAKTRLILAEIQREEFKKSQQNFEDNIKVAWGLVAFFMTLAIGMILISFIFNVISIIMRGSKNGENN